MTTRRGYTRTDTPKRQDRLHQSAFDQAASYGLESPLATPLLSSVIRHSPRNASTFPRPLLFPFRMKTSLALLVAFTSAALAAEPEPPQTKLAQIDKLVLGNLVTGTALAAEWKAAKGKWEVADGAMRAAELAADKDRKSTRLNPSHG